MGTVGSRPTGDRDKRPANAARIMPSLSFSLMPHHVEAIRDAAIHQQVSQSQVVRAALDRFFPEYLPDVVDEDGLSVQHGHGAAVGMAQLVRQLAGLRRELSELRQFLSLAEDAREFDGAPAFAHYRMLDDLAIDSPSSD